MTRNTGQRRYPRIPYRTRVHCSGQGVYFSDLTSNLSEGGVGLQTISQLQPGEELDLAFQLPDSGEELTVRTRVIWTDPVNDQERQATCGLEFQELGERDRERLRFFIQENLS